MNERLVRIKEASKGLLYRSESDYPFEVVYLQASCSLEQELIKLSNNVTDAKVDQLPLEHFFRNMIKVYPDATLEQKEIASNYQQLQTVLQGELQEVSVYRLGEVLIDVVIIGKLPDGSYSGLRTKVVET